MNKECDEEVEETLINDFIGLFLAASNLDRVHGAEAKRLQENTGVHV